jgi:hypothetical protein
MQMHVARFSNFIKKFDITLFICWCVCMCTTNEKLGEILAILNIWILVLNDIMRYLKDQESQ